MVIQGDIIDWVPRNSSRERKELFLSYDFKVKSRVI